MVWTSKVYLTAASVVVALATLPAVAAADPAGRRGNGGNGGGNNGGGGGGNGGGGSGLEQAAEGMADVIAKSVGAILTSLLAAFGLRAFMRRDFGEAIGLVAIGLLVGTFAFHPELAERFIKSTAEAIL